MNEQIFAPLNSFLITLFALLAEFKTAAESAPQGRRRVKRTPQELSEINRQNAMRRWGNAKSHAKSHAGNSHTASRARSRSTSKEVEEEIEKEPIVAKIPAKAPETPKSAWRPCWKRSRKRKKSYTGNREVNRSLAAEKTVLQALGARAWQYEHCKQGFLKRRPGLYFWAWDDVFAVHQCVDRLKITAAEHIDEALDAYFSSGNRSVSAKAVFDQLGRGERGSAWDREDRRIRERRAREAQFTYREPSPEQAAEQRANEEQKVSNHLEAVAEVLDQATIAPQACAAAASRVRDLNVKDGLESLENALGGIESDIVSAVEAAAPEKVRDLEEKAKREMAPYRSRVSMEQMRQMERQIVVKLLLAHYMLPRLSLFYAA